MCRAAPDDHTDMHMWQSRVENEHYSVSMKIEFNDSSNALGYCLCSSRSLAPLHMCATSYGPLRTATVGARAKMAKSRYRL